MSMKKTDLYKNLALATAQRLKNSAKTPKLADTEKAKSKKELAASNPLLGSLIRKAKIKPSKI
jgi:hypothetical protein